MSDTNRKDHFLWKKLTGVEPGVTCWVNILEIDTIQHINPQAFKSEHLLLPNQDDKKDLCVIHTKSGNKLTVEGTPEQILEQS